MIRFTVVVRPSPVMRKSWAYFGKESSEEIGLSALATLVRDRGHRLAVAGLSWPEQVIIQLLNLTLTVISDNFKIQTNVLKIQRKDQALQFTEEKQTNVYRPSNNVQLKFK